jgi:2-polyprenyl-3-methyl-5-hydroxy-6-metoxy-1,4-benzoquinol methylase
MNLSEQQKETLFYFRKSAEMWQQNMEEDEIKKFFVSPHRNRYVLKVADKLKPGKTLDVGCGSGDLVISMAKKGFEAKGIDFAKEMVDLAIRASNENNLQNTQFFCASVFDYDFEHSFDLISANGFIDYISIDQLKIFLKKAQNLLNPNGRLIVSSRNRLFNFISLNKYTRQEIIDKSLLKLIEEAMIITDAVSMEAMINALMEIETVGIQLHPVKDGNIEVAKRLQYTPAQLVQIFTENKFLVEDIYPVHVHCVPPRIKNNNPQLHAIFANVLQNYAHEYFYLLPMASSVMLCASKCS